MIYFLLIDGSYRAVCKGPPPMPPCLCVHSTHLLPPTSVHTHTHAMKQHNSTCCCMTVSSPCGVGSRQSHHRLPLTQGTLSKCDTPCRPHRQGQPCFMSPDRVPCRLQSSCARQHLAPAREKALVSGSGTHSIIT